MYQRLTPSAAPLRTAGCAVCYCLATWDLGPRPVSTRVLSLTMLGGGERNRVSLRSRVFNFVNRPSSGGRDTREFPNRLRCSSNVRSPSQAGILVILFTPSHSLRSDTKGESSRGTSVN